MIGMDLSRRRALALVLGRLMLYPYVSTEEFSNLHRLTTAKVLSNVSQLRAAGYVESAEHVCIAIPHRVPRHWVTNAGVAAYRSLKINEDLLPWAERYTHLARRLLPRLDTVAIINNLAAEITKTAIRPASIRYALGQHPLDAIIRISNARYIGVVHQGPMLPRRSVKARLDRHFESDFRDMSVLFIAPTLLEQEASEELIIENDSSFFSVEDQALQHDAGVWQSRLDSRYYTLEDVLRQVYSIEQWRRVDTYAPPHPPPRASSLADIGMHPLFRLGLRQKRAFNLLPANPLISRSALSKLAQPTDRPLKESDISKIVGPLLREGLIVSESTRGARRYNLSNSGVDLSCRAQRASGPDMLGRLSPEEVMLLSRRGKWHPGRWGTLLRAWERNAPHEDMIRDAIGQLITEVWASRWTLEGWAVAPRTGIDFSVPESLRSFVDSARARWNRFAGVRSPAKLRKDRIIRFHPDAVVALEDYSTDERTHHEGMQLLIEVERKARTSNALGARLLTYLTWSIVKPALPHGVAEGVLFIFQDSRQEVNAGRLLDRWSKEHPNGLPPLATATFAALQQHGFLGPIWSVGASQGRMTLEAVMDVLCTRHE